MRDTTLGANAVLELGFAPYEGRQDPVRPMQPPRAVGQIAAAKGAKPGQIALAWLLQKGDDIVPIPGTKRRHYLEENVAADGIHLTSDQLARLKALPAPAGDRYPDMTPLNR